MISADRSLGYAAAPAFSVPLRFFLTAPVFGVAAGATLFAVPGLLESRWTQGALAVTHLMAVGFVLTVMLGALFQILPVVAGAAIPLSRTVSAVVHLAWTLGALCLAWGLGGGARGYLVAAAGLLGSALTVFLIAAALGLRHAPVAQATPRDLRIALLGLAVAVSLGIVLALVLARQFTLPLLLVLELHIGWALVGGAGLLLAATCWVAVPMFQMTPDYPVALTRFWTSGTGGVLVLWSAMVASEVASAELALAIALAGLCALFAVSTLRLQRRSRRSTPDVTMRAFQLGMASFIAGLACVLVALQSNRQIWPVLAGILILHGGFVSVIVGMLGKIVPFLAWLHLTQEKGTAPHMKKLQPDAPIRRQFAAHAVGLAALVAAAVAGQALLARIAGVMLAVEFAWLLANMLKVIGAYRAARAA